MNPVVLGPITLKIIIKNYKSIKIAWIIMDSSDFYKKSDLENYITNKKIRKWGRK